MILNSLTLIHNCVIILSKLSTFWSVSISSSHRRNLYFLDIICMPSFIFFTTWFGKIFASSLIKPASSKKLLTSGSGIVLSRMFAFVLSSQRVSLPSFPSCLWASKIESNWSSLRCNSFPVASWYCLLISVLRFCNCSVWLVWLIVDEIWSMNWLFLRAWTSESQNFDSFSSKYFGLSVLWVSWFFWITSIFLMFVWEALSSSLRVIKSSFEILRLAFPLIACSKTCITSAWSSVLLKIWAFNFALSWFLSIPGIFVRLLAPVVTQVVKVVIIAVAAKFFKFQSEGSSLPHVLLAHWFIRFQAANWTASWMFSSKISFPIVVVNSFQTSFSDCLDPFLQSSLIKPFATLLPFPSKISFGLISSRLPCNPEERKL